MMRAITICALFLTAFNTVADGPSTRRFPESDTVRLLVPTFAGERGERNIGANVSTILNLQAWLTLRVPFGRPSSTGEVVREEPLPKSTPEWARRAADRNGSHLILWGQAFRYAEQTIVQAYLDLFPRQDRSFQEWTIMIDTPDDRMWAFAADLPSGSYEFEPIVLPTSVVDRYASIGALRIYRDREGRVPVDTVGERTFRALDDYGESIRITYEDDHGRRKTGFVRLPEFDALPTDISDFTGGMIRILRRDWSGATELLGRVARRPLTPTAMRIDAYLLVAMSHAHLNQPWVAEANEAEHLNPYLQSTARYLLMLRLHDLSRAYETGNRDAVVRARAELFGFLARRRSFFDPGDQLIGAIDRFRAVERRRR